MRARTRNRQSGVARPTAASPRRAAAGWSSAGLMMIAATCVAASLPAQETPTRVVSDSLVDIRFVDTDLRSVLQALGRYLDKPLIIGSVPTVSVTMETPAPLVRAMVPTVLRGLVEAHDLELVEDSALYRVKGSVTETRPGRRAAAPGTEATEPPELFVLRLKHARATDVAATVNQLFGGPGAFAGGSGLSSGSLSDELQRNAERTLRGPPQMAEGGSTVSQNAALSGPVTIVPDELTNSLLIRATAEDFGIIEAAVQQLDLRPLQVLIEVLIVEARRGRTFSLGLDAAVENVDLGDGTTGSGFVAGGGLGTFVLQVMRSTSFDLTATLQAAVARGDARIISRPVVVASNNREARILVGSQRPFVQVSRSLPTDTPSRDQVVQYRDVGTKLTVLPTINADGYVSLSIRQEVNAATSETQFDAPVISTREAETEVLVHDGQTVVLGGLREHQVEVTKSGIPLLSQLPIIGGLFGVEDRRNTETELFLFITPTVLADDESADAAASRAMERAEKVGIHRDLPPEKQP